MTVQAGRLEVETPDHVVLRYTLAGIGNRGFAASLDFFLATLLVGGLELGFVLIVRASGSRLLGQLVGAVELLILLLAWLYFIVLEWLWNGQTVGKRLFGLRVIDLDGSPAGFSAIFVRNLVRLVDFLPGFYGLGFLAIVFNSRSQRLGDLAAGTYVVRAPRPRLDWFTLRTIGRTTLSAERAQGVRTLSGEAQRLVREFVSREASLGPRDRTRVAAEIATRLRPLVADIDAADDVEFLRAVASALREAGERR